MRFTGIDLDATLICAYDTMQPHGCPSMRACAECCSDPQILLTFSSTDSVDYTQSPDHLHEQRNEAQTLSKGEIILLSFIFFLKMTSVECTELQIYF